MRPAERYAWIEDLDDGAKLRLAVQPFTLAGSFTVSFDDDTAVPLVMGDANACAHR